MTTIASPRAPFSLDLLLNTPKKKWSDIAGTAASIAIPLAILGAVVINAHGLDVARLAAVAPGASLFWPAFVLLYATLPVSYWIIYRRIWNLPIAGLVPLFRKQVANEIVVGYAGEAHFYFWARRHAGLTGSPFGAIKDVSVLSAVAGNVITLVLMALTARDVTMLMHGGLAATFRWSIAVIVICSLVPFLFRRRLFSLPPGELRFVLGVHFARSMVSMVLTAATWHFLFPAVSLATWLSLNTLRMMISRLPLVANKDILFAAATLLLLGDNADAALAIAFTASLTLLAHLVVGATTGVAALVERRRGAN